MNLIVGQVQTMMMANRMVLMGNQDDADDKTLMEVSVL